MNKMYYLTGRQQLPIILKKGIQIDNKDLLPRTYLADQWQWILKIAEIFNSLTEVSGSKTIVVLELDLAHIQVFSDDIPSDLLPEYWDRASKDEYSKHCYYTAEKIPVSSIVKIYDIDGNDITKLIKINEL